jgi:hypothetical protein
MTTSGRGDGLRDGDGWGFGPGDDSGSTDRDDRGNTSGDSVADGKKTATNPPREDEP